jgi:hypothetical protein
LLECDVGQVVNSAKDICLTRVETLFLINDGGLNPFPGRNELDLMIASGDWRIFGRRAKGHVGEEWRAVDDHIEVGRARRCVDHPHCCVRLSRLALGRGNFARRSHCRNERKHNHSYRDDPPREGGSLSITA